MRPSFEGKNAPLGVTESAADFAHLGVVQAWGNLGNHVPVSTLTILAGPQVILFDAYTFLSENGLVKGEYTLDLLHLNSTGYAALNLSLIPLLLDLAQAHRLQPKA